MDDVALGVGEDKSVKYAVEQVKADIILNSNENNYPMPEEVREKIQKTISGFPFHLYPPVKAEFLVQNISDELNISCDNIKIGNGAGELLQRICCAFGGSGKIIAYPFPSIVFYKSFIETSGSTAVSYSLEPDGYLKAENVIAFCREKKPDLLIICNPNNPTGNYNSLKTVEKILANVSCPVVVDETYIEFAEGNEIDALDLRPLNKIWLVAGSVLTLQGRYSNLICVRSFSKAYGLAGVRCGYAVGSSLIMQHLDSYMLPYNVSSLSLIIAKIVYEHKNLYKSIIKEIIAERKKLSSFLQTTGFEVWPSGGNFVLIRPAEKLVSVLAESYNEVYGPCDKSALSRSGCFVYRYLLQQGILVADFSDYPGLEGCLRITVGTPEENVQVCKKLEILYRDAVLINDSQILK